MRIIVIAALVLISSSAVFSQKLNVVMPGTPSPVSELPSRGIDPMTDSKITVTPEVAAAKELMIVRFVPGTSEKDALALLKSFKLDKRVISADGLSYRISVDDEKAGDCALVLDIYAIVEKIEVNRDVLWSLIASDK